MKDFDMMLRSVFLSLLCVAAASAAQAAGPAASAPASASVPAKTPMIELGSEVVKFDNVVGSGPEARLGTTVTVHYTGWFFKPLATNQRGRQFDSSLDAGKPFEFRIGAGQVIKGWEQGVVGMKVGGKRTLAIPSALAYGSRGAGGGIIPPDSDLIFEIEMLQMK
ncbi:MAG TPA: FKBP-type peptidyl-prolyl cis-trans isomerase [Paucimonas sp.]|nr:FKBP-type peptidyl-prolyl cis-trans isomerase [Paucimonas sp.]